MSSVAGAAPRRIALAARIGYVAVILLATLTALHARTLPGEVAERLARAFSPTLRARDAVDAVRNVVLFAGFGAVWLATAASGRVWRGVRDATAAGALVGCFVETVQLVSPVRTSSVVDVVTNALGALSGALLLVLLAATTRPARGRRSFVGVPAFVFAGAYSAAALLEAFAPLERQERIPNLWGSPLHRLAVAAARLEWRSLLSVPFVEGVLFAPAGAFCVAAMVEAGLSYAAAWRWTAAGALAFAVLAELAHGAVGQPIDLGAVAAHALGTAFGAWGARRWLPSLSTRLRGRARPLALLAAYAVVLALWSWRPFLPETSAAEILKQLSFERFVPLRALVDRVDLFSVAQVGLQFALYAPLGALLAVWPLRSGGALRHLLPAFYLSALLEGGQILVHGRYFNVTDVLIQLAGAALGWTVIRRIGFRAYGEALPRD